MFGIYPELVSGPRMTRAENIFPCPRDFIRKAVIAEDFVDHKNHVVFFAEANRHIPFFAGDAMPRRVMRRNQQQDFRFLRSSKQAVGIQHKSKRRLLSFQLQKIRRAFQMFQLSKRIKQRISRHRRQNYIARVAESLE